MKTKSRAIAAVAAATVAATGSSVLAGSPAWASDTFTLNNDTGTTITVGSVGTYDDGPCGVDISTQNGWLAANWGGPYDADSSQPPFAYSLVTFDPTTGNITGSEISGNISFDVTEGGCSDILMADGQSLGLNYTFDDPVFGSASLSCSINSPNVAEVDGLTCSITSEPTPQPLAGWAKNALNLTAVSAAGQRRLTHVRFSANVASMRNGVAYVPVAVYRAQQSVKARVVLARGSRHKLVGNAVTRIRSHRPGQADFVKVPLTKKVRKAVAAGQEVHLQAAVAHADGTQGTGDYAVDLIVRKAR